MIYFSAGNAYIRSDELRDQARCPIYCYGVEDYGLFVFDTTYAGACDDNQAKRRAHEIAVLTSLALTFMANSDPAFATRFAKLIDGQI